MPPKPREQNVVKIGYLFLEQIATQKMHFKEKRTSTGLAVLCHLLWHATNGISGSLVLRKGTY